MCGRRCGSVAKFPCFNPTHLLVIAFAAGAVDALLLSSPGHEPVGDAAPHALLESRGKSPAPELPKHKRIAIVLRGETFRYIYTDENGAAHRKPCAEEAKPMQMNATESLLTQIIEPLEQRGNRIEVLLASTCAVTARFQALHKGQNGLEVPGCPLDRVLNHALQANNRVVKYTRFFSTGQADSMLKVLNAFNQEYGGTAEAVRAHFDYVMIIRTDMKWHQSFVSIQETYHPDFENVNVQRRCEVGASEGKGGRHCILDTFWMMPAKVYPEFVSTVGHDNCFDPQFDPAGNGHACQMPLRRAMAKAGHRNGFGWIEPEQVWARGRSKVADLIR